MTYHNDWRKVILAEIMAGRELNTLAWTEMVGGSGGSTYYTTVDTHEILTVKGNGVELDKVADASTVQWTSSSWYHDFANNILYVHLADGSDPGAHISGPYYYNSVVIYFQLCFTNRQGEGANCIDFIPEGCTYNVYYEPWLNENSIDSLSAVLSDHFETAMEIQFGSLSFINTGWWYTYRHVYLWNNRDVKIKVGELGDTYAKFETIFVGKVRGPRINDECAQFELVDTRVGSLYSIPTHRFSLTTYPNLDDDAIDRPIPILFGQKTNITPTCVSTSTLTYKVSDTVWDGVTFPMESIYRVYKGGIQLIPNVDYTVDLNTGEFTLLADPLEEIITCDAKGIKDKFNMITGTATGAYSENVADHLFFIFNVLNEIPVANIDLPSFWDLQNARTQKVAWYLDTDTPTMDVNRMFQQSSIYHFLPLQDGKFAAKYYRRLVPSGTINLLYYDLKDFTIYDQPENVYYGVIIKYDKDPTTGIWKTASNTTNSVLWQYSEKQTFEVETALRDGTEAMAVCVFYSTLLQAPADKLETDISLVGRDLLPSEKLIITRSVEAENSTVPILSDDVYVILETHKDFSGGKVGIVAQLDTQLSIYPVYSDLDHADSHSDHTDSVHSDVTHADAGYYDHADYDDISHSDVAHEDVAHADAEQYDDHTDHDDMLYSDDYTDDAHEDTAHEDVAHVDASHNDHEDTYSDTEHSDVAHGDYDDFTYVDVHEDVAHIDSEL